jgi:hypothetical protein
MLGASPGVELCAGKSELGVCQRYSRGPNQSLCNISGNFDTCDCLVIYPDTKNSASLITYLNSFEDAQAPVQFTFALLSLVFGAMYMGLFLLRPREMWRYPQSLAFWIYACDFLKSASLVVVSGLLLAYESKMSEQRDVNPFVVTWHPDCLCNASHISDPHPGCACESGVLAVMLQAGLIGSVAFYFAMAHNFYMSVKDPFTKPQSRLAPYHIVCWSLVLVLTAFYLPWASYLNHDPSELAAKLTGFGYRAGYLACWFPQRVTQNAEGFSRIISNPQIHVTLTLPIGIAWLATPCLYVLARRALRVGGAHEEEMRAPRAKQLQHGQTLVGVFVVYIFLTGLLYFLSFAVSCACPPRRPCARAGRPMPTLLPLVLAPRRYWGEAKGKCETLEMGAVLSYRNPAQGAADQHPCRWVGLLQAGFSTMLAAGGAINALAGLYVHHELLVDTLSPLWRRAAALVRPPPPSLAKGDGRADSAEGAESEAAASPAAALVTQTGDISVSLRADIIAMTVRAPP